jgi:poly(A) polymerase
VLGWAALMAGSVGVGRAAPRSSPKRYAGTDPPLSLAGPTMADLQRTAELEKVILCCCLRFSSCRHV